MLTFGKPVFIPNPAGILALEDHPLVALGLTAKAESIAETAKSISPVRTGAFRDSIHVEQTEDGPVVTADVEYARFVELGTSDTPAFAPLRRAAESG